MNETKLRVWWISQIGTEAFYIPVKSVKEAKKTMDLLSYFDCFQYNQKIRPDYSNTGGLEMFNEETGEWEDWVYGLMSSKKSIRGIFVDTNTIGQYTGLTDMNGTKIFEGDIIQSYHHGEPMGVASVYWEGASFWCKLLSGSQFDCCDTLDEWDCECGLEIIGNVYDGQDLIDKAMEVDMINASIQKQGEDD